MSVSNTSYMNGRDENGWENFLWRSTKKILPDAKQKKVLYLISYIIDRVLYMVYKIIVQWLTRVRYKSNCKRFMLLWMSLLLRQKPVRWCFALLLFRWLVRSVRLIQCSIDLISSISWFDLWLFCFGDRFDQFVWCLVQFSTDLISSISWFDRFDQCQQSWDTIGMWGCAIECNNLRPYFPYAAIWTHIITSNVQWCSLFLIFSPKLVLCYWS